MNTSPSPKASPEVFPERLLTLLKHTSAQNTTRFENIRLTLSDDGIYFTVRRQHMSSGMLQEDHAGNKDQVWLKEVSEDQTCLVVNTIEDHYGQEEWHGQVVTITVRIRPRS